VPVEFAVGVYEDLFASGADLGVVDGGYYAIEAMRLEKGYRAFGRELTPDYNPVEAGLLFTCKLKTDIPFLGRQAVEKAKASGTRRKLVSFVVDDAEPMLWGGELILRDGVPTGQVMSAAWGETLGACVGLAYVWDPAGTLIDRDWVLRGGFEVDVNGSRWPVTASLRPPFDPDGKQIRP
jgi:glycine cleavage system aminomethyltransferase T